MSLRQWQEVQEVLRRLTRASARVLRSTLQLRMKRLGIVPRIAERRPTLTGQQRDATSLVVRTMGLALRPIIKQPSDSGPERAGVPTLDRANSLAILWTDRSREESTDGVMYNSRYLTEIQNT
jgi:hypothetical protein